jgi:hypothetical protein
MLVQEERLACGEVQQVMEYILAMSPTDDLRFLNVLRCCPESRIAVHYARKQMKVMMNNNCELRKSFKRKIK